MPSCIFLLETSLGQQYLDFQSLCWLTGYIWTHVVPRIPKCEVSSVKSPQIIPSHWRQGKDIPDWYQGGYQDKFKDSKKVLCVEFQMEKVHQDSIILEGIPGLCDHSVCSQGDLNCICWHSCVPRILWRYHMWGFNG